MRIMALSAHPDDVEINCAGTLALYRLRGDEVHIVHACSGDKGHKTIPPQQLGPMRIEESVAAGQVIGAKVTHLGYDDAELFYGPQSVAAFTRAIRNIAPDVIITHTTQDYHLDHVAVARLAIDASFLVTVPHYLPDTPALERVPQIYCMEPYTGIGFVPGEFVDITDTLEAKLSMMRCHKTQLEWLQEHDGLDTLSYITVSASYRGFQCGCRYAEGFTRYVTSLRAVPGRFLP